MRTSLLTAAVTLAAGLLLGGGIAVVRAATADLPATPPASPAAAPASRPLALDADWAPMRAIVPRGYVCVRATGPVAIDGKADEAAWAAAPWTDDFVDIQGAAKPAPKWRTRAKMLWDDEAFYVHAELTEPHVWGTITKRNEVIFHDNDFEVFIDPDGDNHHYYEFEMNALNTVWELTLVKPYRDGGPARNGTNLAGLRSAVHVDGTLNDPSDADKSWSVEIAFPWKSLAAYAGVKACPPHDGDQWRVDFSRVEWTTEVIDGKYRKVPKRPEDNWVWSPPGVIDMHRPERWGYVQFSTTPATPNSPAATFRPDPTLPARDALMEVYYRQRAFKKQAGRCARTSEELGLGSAGSGPAPAVELVAKEAGYTATARVPTSAGAMRVLHVRDDSKLWED